MPKKLYVGNLSYTTNDTALADLFGTVGEVLSAKVVTDRFTGQSRGFGFVEMAEHSAALEAINKLNGHTLDGRAIKVAEARPQRPEGQPGGRHGGGRRRY